MAADPKAFSDNSGASRDPPAVVPLIDEDDTAVAQLLAIIEELRKGLMELHSENGTLGSPVASRRSGN